MALVTAIALLTACDDAPREPGDPELAARGYCEITVGVFCDYYLRCGRMAEDDMAACRSTFLETCNAVYEPHYAALADGDRLALSRDGLAECAAHLRQVDCEDQIFDLDGGCASLWVGKVEAGGECAPGIESFVCDDASTCVLGLDLCGTCEPAVGIGDPCADNRCKPPGTCVDDVCVAGALPGDACGDVQPCVSGAWCDDDVCVTYAYVGLGDPCDATHRCPYRSACVGSTCQQSALLGETCGPAGCASGWCDAGVCALLGAEGDACTGGWQCLSGACDGTCVGLPGVCFSTP